jgi:hypothetical protein
VLLDSGAEQAIVGKVSAPLNRSVFARLNTCYEKNSPGFINRLGVKNYAL